MSKLTKITLIAIGGLVGLLALSVVALLVFVNPNAYKPQLEAAASRGLGMEVKVEGPLGISLFPGLSVTLQDVHIRNRGAEVASAAKAKLGIELLPLLHKQVRITTIVLNHPTISIERERSGRFNFTTAATAGGGWSSLKLTNLSFADGTLHYANKQTGEEFEAESCNLQVHHLQLSQAKRLDPMQGLSFTADLACRDIRRGDFTVSDLKILANGKSGVFDLQPVSMQIFGARGTGSVHADFSGAIAHYTLRYSLPQFQIAEFFKLLSPRKVAEGSMDFSANLSLQGSTADEMRRSLKGQLSLQGKDLTLTGYNLDEEISRFNSSQNFNLVDVGAFFFAGPLGLVVAKGYGFSSLLQGTSGSSKIRTLVSKWKVERGVAQAQDVAMATNKNRIALQGRLDFINNTFDDVTVAVINAEGCAKLQQKITGSFQKPILEKPSIIKTLTGPVRKLVKAASNLVAGGKCKVFYAGSVAPPK